MVKNKFKSIRTLQLILTFLILNSTFYIAQATVRYVSHAGSNTPPYLTWETAADSIMFAINISVFGDTIYVANGIYEEQVIMIPGLSLIGAGMDSCVIDTREFATSTSFRSVQVSDSCVFEGFKIIVANNIEYGGGVAGTAFNSLIKFNRIIDGGYGIVNGNYTTIYNNICSNISIGVYLYNSNAVVRKNIIHIPPNSSSLAGIRIGAFDYSYEPIIDSNHIVVEGLAFTAADGIYHSLGARPIITNNTIIIKGPQNDGILLGDTDSAWVYNNLIIADPGDVGLRNYWVSNLQLYNNYFGGEFLHNPWNLSYVVVVGLDNVVKNNVITGGGDRGLRVWENENPVVQYNNCWNNRYNYSGFLPDSTNLSVDPMIVNDDSTLGDLDFHLQMYSQLIDAGDPNILDVDGSRSDIGLYGGPFGESYTYQDLAPKPPRNLTAVVDSEYITLSWNRNTESDFMSYKLFRDTTSNFTADSTTLVSSLTDTFYVQIILQGVDAFYYKLTATDNQENESQPSEELAVIITSVNDYPVAVSNYRLYQNYPNPFNPSTMIGYKLKERGYVKLYVYDIKGELVSVSVNQIQDAGYYEVDFSGDGQGTTDETLSQKLASGIYIYQIMIKSENNIPIFTDMKKMILLK